MGSDLHRDLPPQLDSWPSLSPHVKQAVTYELSHSGLMPSTGHDYDFFHFRDEETESNESE